jgi:hypothetical protein
MFMKQGAELFLLAIFICLIRRASSSSYLTPTLFQN